ncbi:MAG: hypothetical protein U9N80_10825 [Chloroflexota bacterium]|nr:hypothetical protein [Chloroflexota bacterium]
MNDFFTNLVGRHLGTCDTIQPRTLGRFEVDRGRVVVASPDEGTNMFVSENDQTFQPPQSPDELSYELPKVTIHEPDPIGGEKDYLSPAHPDQSDSLAQLGLTEQHAVQSDSYVLPGKPYDAQPLDADRYFHLGALEQEQANKTALVDEHDAFNYGHVQTNISESHEVTHDNPPPPASRAGEHYLENQLNHRIRAILQRLADDPVTPIIEPTADDRGSLEKESLISFPAEKTAPLLSAAVASLDPAPTLEQLAGRHDKISADNRENTALYGRLEPPSWLPDMEAQFNQRLQEKEAKAEPVINVTIGRVEVRAVQADAPKKAKHQKKPSGVMSLDEYLNQRERRG